MAPKYESGLLADGTPDWTRWLDPAWAASCLRGLLTQTPKFLVQLARISAVETIRGGKVVFHWNFNLNRLVHDFYSGTVLQTEEVFWLTPLAESPLLSGIDLEHLEGIHPDMVTIIASYELSGESSKATGQEENTTIVVPFEIDYDTNSAKKYEEMEAKIPRARIERVRKVVVCFACRKEIPLVSKFMTCAGCKIAKCCNAVCEETLGMMGHGEICEALPQACLRPAERCLKPPL